MFQHQEAMKEEMLRMQVGCRSLEHVWKMTLRSNSSQSGMWHERTSALKEDIRLQRWIGVFAEFVEERTIFWSSPCPTPPLLSHFPIWNSQPAWRLCSPPVTNSNMERFSQCASDPNMVDFPFDEKVLTTHPPTDVSYLSDAKLWKFLCWKMRTLPFQACVWLE